jgi:hypothetical protein
MGMMILRSPQHQPSLTGMNLEVGILFRTFQSEEVEVVIVGGESLTGMKNILVVLDMIKGVL